MAVVLDAGKPVMGAATFPPYVLGDSSVSCLPVTAYMQCKLKREMIVDCLSFFHYSSGIKS